MRQAFDFSHGNFYNVAVIIERAANSPVTTVSIIPKVMIRNRVPRRLRISFQKQCKYQYNPKEEDMVEAFTQHSCYSLGKYMYIVGEDGKYSPAIPYVYDKTMQLRFCGSVIAVKVVRSQGLDVIDLFTCQYQQYLVQNQTSDTITIFQQIPTFEQSALNGPENIAQYHVEPGICLNYILDDLLQEHPTITIVASGVSTDVRLDFEKEGAVAAG